MCSALRAAPTGTHTRHASQFPPASQHFQQSLECNPCPHAKCYPCPTKHNVHPCGTRLGTDGKTYALSQQSAERSAKTDRYGAAIPERLTRAFDLREYRQRIQTIQNAKSGFEKSIKEEDYSCSKISQATLITFANLIHDLKSGEPWCVCRQCGGTGCRACGNVGVQTMDEYLRNPKELRPDA